MSVNLQPTMAQITKMMTYLNMWSFVVPSYNMKTPEEADGSNFRSERTFRLLRSGMMNYHGSGELRAGKADIHVGGIKPNQQWLDRAYTYLTKLVQNKIATKTIHSKMPDVQELLLWFNDLEFISMDATFDP